jgi:hypothetical protein
MNRFAIKFLDEPRNARCPLCDQPGLQKKGPHLFLGEGDDPICRPCAKRLAPTLLALVDLAQVADKAGRQCRHLLTPPMETMLELSRAAENYTYASPRARACAG